MHTGYLRRKGLAAARTCASGGHVLALPLPVADQLADKRVLPSFASVCLNLPESQLVNTHAPESGGDVLADVDVFQRMRVHDPADPHLHGTLSCRNLADSTNLPGKHFRVWLTTTTDLGCMGCRERTQVEHGGRGVHAEAAFSTLVGRWHSSRVISGAAGLHSCQVRRRDPVLSSSKYEILGTPDVEKQVWAMVKALSSGSKECNSFTSSARSSTFPSVSAFTMATLIAKLATCHSL